MGRVPQISTKIKATIGALVIVVLTVWGVQVNHHHAVASGTKPTTVATSQTTEVSYQGQNGVDALTLLKKHAQVTTKTSSLGEYVTAINGNNGGGSKYWIFYVNGQEAQVGAGAYITKNADNIQWKLQ